MRYFNLKFVMSVCHFVYWQSHHSCFIDCLARLMTKASFSENHKNVLVTEPFGHFINRFAVGFPECVTRGEEDWESLGLWLIWLPFYIQVSGVWGKAIKFLQVEINLLLNVGPCSIEFFLHIRFFTANRVNWKVFDWAIFKSVSLNSLQVTI